MGKNDTDTASNSHRLNADDFTRTPENLETLDPKLAA